MTRLEALKDLKAKVEAGDLTAIDREFFRAMGGKDYSWPDGNARSADNAYRGSLDAAKALHEAVLPGWAVGDLSQNGRLVGHPWGIRLAFWDGSNPNNNLTVDVGWGALPKDVTPARAWLIAVLAALIEQEEQQ